MAFCIIKEAETIYQFEEGNDDNSTILEATVVWAFTSYHQEAS